MDDNLDKGRPLLRKVCEIDGVGQKHPSTGQQKYRLCLVGSLRGRDHLGLSLKQHRHSRRKGRRGHEPCVP